jgi:hypothetical protein
MWCRGGRSQGSSWWTGGGDGNGWPAWGGQSWLIYMTLSKRPQIKQLKEIKINNNNNNNK